ncbi:MAG: TMEM165/GDT1 family protein [Desulfobacterium sp.]|nr:TMEM165/GDT1 family protein [Desulfobacterium sp.]MBU3947265.1 TMEM165/GDT1 family protein [Pseudomonadota bacterium]MBU4009783.1 TMEM165/GDT1 family protein [Pseudomonadota bacterium]MBU4035256.1 TMEM165/GDT1 family protein [Pseudomonadota bacterium]
MDYKILATTFVMVFLAELGDKTQLATFCLSADNDSKVSVFIGSASALVLSSFLAVLCGTALSKFIPVNYIKIAAGIFFIVVGAWTIYAVVKAT